MGRCSTLLLALLLGVGLIGLGLAGPFAESVRAQSAKAGKARPGAKAIKAARPDTKEEDDQDNPDDEEKEEGAAAGAQKAPTDSDSVLGTLMQRREAVQGLTRRGQSIANAPPFTVIEREPQLEFYPCADCHEDQTPNPKVRELKDEHTSLDFQHGGGRFWCYDACHNRKDMNRLVSLHGEPISFNEPYKLCGQCHFQRQKDWFFGGHGKRAGSFLKPREIPAEHSKIDFSKRNKIGTWRSDKRVLFVCTQCHDAHSPSIKPYQPSPPPEVRRGLTRHEEVREKHVTVWQSMEPAPRGKAK